MLEREWVSIRDPEDDHLRYTFDVTFLLSNYECIYGAGCPGINGDEVVGCCEHGAYYVEDEERERIEGLVDELGPEFLDRYAYAQKRGVSVRDEDGEWKTRVVNGGCIFVNGADFPAGSGCAFHVLAMARGEHHMTYKPTVCWQVPLHREIGELTANDGETLEVHTIGPFERGTWGGGGADFDWWCIDGHLEAFAGRRPVYVSMEHELRAMVGDEVYEQLAEHLDTRRRQRKRPSFLPVVGSGV